MARVGVSPVPEIAEELEPDESDEFAVLALALRDPVALHGATLASFKVMPNGLGFDVHFTVPLTEAEKLPALTAYLQRLCEVSVVPFSRRRGVVAVDDDDWGPVPDVWEGINA